MIEKIQRKYVQYIYADQNQSWSVKKTLKKLLRELEENNGLGLNVGAGNTNLHPRIKNLDLFQGKHIDYIGSATHIPIEDNTFDLVITQETLEHVNDPFKAVEEIYRILKSGGKFYCQLPFIIGFHPGPTDYWRFTKEGIEELVVSKGFKIIEQGITLHGSSGYYRISVEYFSILVSLPVPFLYKIFKLLFSLLLYPIKLLDYLVQFSPQKDRIPGGYFVVAMK